MAPQTVGDLFVEAVRRFPARALLRWLEGDAEHELSYAQAAGDVLATIEALRAAGATPGERVVVATADIRGTILFDLACAVAGVVHVPAIPPEPPTVSRLLRRVEGKAVFAVGERAQLLEREGFPLVTLPAAGSAGSEADAARRLEGARATLDGESLYMLQPTSGTTSDPKLVMRQHKVFTRVARVLTPDLDAASGERILVVAALTHGMGQYLLATGLSLAATFVVPNAGDAASSLGEVRRLDPTYLGLTPRVIRSYVDQHGGVRSDARLFGPGARTLATGASKPDDELLRYIESQGVRVIETYGAAEFSLVAASTPGGRRPGVVGRVLPDVTLRVAPDGELLAKTPVMMAGYYGDEELTRAAFDEDGFYKTGDRCEITEEDELKVLGRKRDVLNVRGSNISPQLGEHRMERLPWVGQVVLLGDQRPFVGALVVPPADVAATPAERRALAPVIAADVADINQELEPAARVGAVRLVGEPLPEELYRVVGHGKVSRDRAGVARRYEAEVAALFGRSEGTVEIPGAFGDGRRAPRFHVVWLAKLAVGEHVLFGYAHDVSTSGALIRARGAGSLSGSGRVSFVAGGRMVSLEAVVARVVEGGVAVQFESPARSRELLVPLLPG